MAGFFCIVEFALIRLTKIAEKVFMHYRRLTGLEPVSVLTGRI